MIKIINRPLFICLVDYENAFDDRVSNRNGSFLYRSESIGVTNRRSSFKTEIVVILWRNGKSKPLQITEARSLLPILFNVYVDMIVNEVVETAKSGLSIEAENNLKFADDQALIAACTGKPCRGC